MYTRMHSSRMRIVRCSGRLGGCLHGQVSVRGCLPRECLPGGVSQRGVSAWGMCLRRITDRCKNIIFPQLHLQMVKLKVVWGRFPHNPPQLVHNKLSSKNSLPFQGVFEFAVKCDANRLFNSINLLHKSK